MCVTFTKSAALEMQERLDAQIALWAQCDLSVLVAQLTVLLGREPREKELRQARFLKEQQEKDPVTIQTFHSFCHDLLMRFPIESNLNIPLQIWDQAMSLRMWVLAYETVLSHTQEQGVLGQVVQRLMAAGSDIHAPLEEMFHRRMLPKKTEDAQVLNFSSDDFLQTHPNMVPEIHGLKAADQEFLARLIGITRGSPEYCSIFVAKERKKSPLNHELLQKWHHEECRLMQEMHQAQAGAQNAQKSLDYDTLFAHVMNAYTQSKQGALDFNDLTLKTLDLLEDSTYAGWVAHTMYHQIKHMLVDEAQDTSRHQWKIFRQLIEAVVVNPHRSVCVVGDPKQSIYGFHGADPEGFFLMRNFVKAWVLAHDGCFYDVTLSVSFRSAPAILQLVNGVFRHSDVTGMDFADHTSFYPQRQGQVELWSLPPEDMDLAEQWVKTLDQWKAQPFFLPSKNRTVQSHDIMIILPRRTSFFKSLQGHLYRSGWLQRKDIAYKDDPVMGMMVAWCRVMLYPDDDVALAAFLEGVSLFGCKSWVFHAAYQRGRISIWKHIEQLAESDPFFAAFYGYVSWVRRSRTKNRLLDLVVRWVYEEKGGAFLSIIGPDAQQVIDVFIQALTQWPDPDDGAGFLDWIQQEDTVFKTNNPGGVTLLTIHGAKGGQAPVVILPDLPLPVDKDDREYWRLLYVAMTRAEDRLYLSSRKETPWYSAIRDAMTGICPQPFVDKESDILVRYRHCDGQDLSLGSGVNTPIITAEDTDMPSWVTADYGVILKNDGGGGPEACFSPLIDGLLQGRYDHDATVSPNFLRIQPEILLLNRGQRTEISMTPRAYMYRRRGMALHQLLDELPHSAKENWSKTAMDFLKKQGLGYVQSRYWAMRVVALLGRPDLSPLFFEARAEVEWVGRDELRRMDRLLVRQNHVWIVDFKSDDWPMDKPWDAMPYVDQMQHYVNLVQPLYPKKRIHRGILWLKSGLLQWHPNDHCWEM